MRSAKREARDARIKRLERLEIALIHMPVAVLHALARRERHADQPLRVL
ncbi:hypothetical protein ACGF8D_26735 [Streptomyces massasporeus]